MAPDALPSRAEVVVIGAGIVGASIAFHLAEAGVRDVLVLEAERPGSGSSGKPLGGVRAAFSDPLNVLLGARSLEAYRGFARRPGAEIGLQTVGYLFLLREPQDVAPFERSVALQNALGVPSRMLDAAEAARLCPLLDPAALRAAAFSPGDGFARPQSVVDGYLAAARRRGTRVVERCRVGAIDVEAGEIVAVRTPLGRVRISTVVCAAGAWSRELGALCGVALDVRPLRRQIALSEPLAPAPPRIPFTIDYASSAYVHNAGDALLLGMSDQGQPYGFDRAVTTDWLPALRAALGRCAPALRDVPLAGGWAGLYEMTPDANALVGESPAVGRFLYATGFSGHGFVQAPAVGELIRDLVLGREPFVDVTPLRAQRFADKAPIAEANIV